LRAARADRRARMTPALATRLARELIECTAHSLPPGEADDACGVFLLDGLPPSSAGVVVGVVGFAVAPLPYSAIPCIGITAGAGWGMAGWATLVPDGSLVVCPKTHAAPPATEVPAANAPAIERLSQPMGLAKGFDGGRRNSGAHAGAKIADVARKLPGTN
jgi:hypothetical protein